MVFGVGGFGGSVAPAAREDVVGVDAAVAQEGPDATDLLAALEVEA
jgi:hypothetical protein